VAVACIRSGISNAGTLISVYVTNERVVLIPGPSSVYGKANHQGARAKGYQADGWTWDQLFMKEKILINHWRWLTANGYKQQASSCKQQALELTKKNYCVIGESRRKNYENK